MAAPFKDGKMWRHRFMLAGTRKSGTFPTKAAALVWEAEQRSADPMPQDSGKTCGDAFTKYAAEVSPKKDGARWEQMRLAKFGQTNLAKVLVSKVTATDVAAWRDNRIKEVSDSTVLREMNLMSHVFTIARKEWTWLAESPTRDVARPKENEPRDRRISQDEIDRICLALGFSESPATSKSQIVGVAFLFAIETAMRSGEICALQHGWIAGSVIHLPANVIKNGTKRDIPLSTRALELLTYLPKHGLVSMGT